MSQGRVYKRGNVWWVSYYHKGKEVRESSGSPEEKDAKRLLKARIGGIMAERYGGQKFLGPKLERVTVDELLNNLETEYQTAGRWDVYSASHMKPVRRLLGNHRAAGVDAAKLRQYTLTRQGEGVANGTIVRELALLRRAFNLSEEDLPGLRTPRVPRLKVGGPRQGFFEREELDRVLEYLPGYLRDVALFTYLVGWRRGEVRSLEWAHVDLDGRVIKLPGSLTKNGKGRTLPLVGELWDLITRRHAGRVLNDRMIPWVFHRQGKYLGDFRRAWVTACEKAGLEGKLFHDFRRTAVRNLVRAGVPERVAMEVTGHRTRAIFDRYNIVNEEDLGRAVEQVQAYLAGQPTEPRVRRINES